MTKPTKWPVRPARTQISLGIRPDWSESLLGAQVILLVLSCCGSNTTDCHWYHELQWLGRLAGLQWPHLAPLVHLLVAGRMSEHEHHKISNCQSFCCFHDVISMIMKIWIRIQQNLYTRGIWKVRIMVQFFSNRLTNPFMFGISLNSYLCSMLGNKFKYGVQGMWQAQYILLLIHILFRHWKKQILMK